MPLISSPPNISWHCDQQRRVQAITETSSAASFLTDLRMEFYAFSLKCRCPAPVYELECKGYRECHQQHGVQVPDYGRLVRVKLDRNRRIFTPRPRRIVVWSKGYDRRTVLKRIFSRFDQGCRFERHHIRGPVKMKTRVSIAIMMALALAHYRADRKHQMRSLVQTWRPSEAAWSAPDRKMIAVHEAVRAATRLESAK